MGESSAIEWTDHTWSPWIGCTKVSPACDGCYAEHLMDTRLGRVEWGPHGLRKRTSESYWREPLKWNGLARLHGRPETVFPSLCDPFDNRADPAVRGEWFDLIRSTTSLVWLLLTKRPQNILRLAEQAGGLPKNVALGTTCEDQERADQNVPALLSTAYDLRPIFTFVSAEPLLGPIDFRRIRVGRTTSGATVYRDALKDCDIERIDWIITGGETDQGKHKARPTNPQWFRDIRDACAQAGVPYLHKQNGEWASVSEVEGSRIIHEFEDGRCVRRVGKRAAGRLLDGVEHNGMPEVRLG